MRFDQRTAASAAPAREPGQRAFGFIVGDAGAPALGDELALGQNEMPGAKGIDLGQWRQHRSRPFSADAHALVRNCCCAGDSKFMSATSPLWFCECRIIYLVASESKVLEKIFL